mgnify:FL=1
MRADHHPEEEKRIACLKSLGVLDTPPDPRFDDITRLATLICDAPTALVSLVDQDRQWFKARVGFDHPQTDLDRSICSHTILGPDPLIINDLLQDPRTADNPLATGKDAIRFYAGVPLVGRDGLPYGALCVLDTKPRVLSPTQIESLERLGRQVVQLLETELLLREKQIALDRAELLKEEIDHRVGNSLQQVVTLLRLQARAHANRNDRSVEVIEDAQRRVEAIASFHHRLSRLADGDSVDLARLIDGLLEDLGHGVPPNITLHHEVEPGLILARLALSIATLINEFLANSIKHAFPGKRRGQITIKASWQGRTLVLELSDDGVGMDATASAESGAGLGMKVIDAAAATLSAEVEVLDGPGTGLRLTIPAQTLRPGEVA